jgi:hypothetical protein
MGPWPESCTSFVASPNGSDVTVPSNRHSGLNEANIAGLNDQVLLDRSCLSALEADPQEAEPGRRAQH